MVRLPCWINMMAFGVISQYELVVTDSHVCKSPSMLITYPKLFVLHGVVQRAEKLYVG